MTAPTTAGRVAVYPGSFNPPTVAHLEVSAAARRQHRLDRVVWSISRVALGKESIEHPRFEHRWMVVEAIAAATSWLDVQVTDAQLLVDVAAEFDLLVMGADKWAQIQRIEWYGDLETRDAALAALPPVAVAPRPPHPVPRDLALDIGAEFHSVSSTAVRQGATEHMLPEARAFAEQTGAWIDPARYERWLTSGDR